MTSIGIRIRRCRAQAAIGAYSDLVPPSTLPDTITDLLTDLRHWCDAQNVDFARSLERSQLHHQAEAGGAS